MAESGRAAFADAVAASGDSPVVDNACTSGIATPSTLPFDAQKLMALWSCSKQMGLFSAERSSNGTTSMMASGDPQPGNLSGTRDDSTYQAIDGDSSSADATEPRLSDTSAGEMTPSEGSDVEPVWPEEAELYLVAAEMLTGGSGVPAAPSKRYEPAEATYTLLVRVKAAVAKLKNERGSEMHMVPGTAGRIDQQEGRGYVLGAVLGRGLLDRSQAAAAGLDARNKLTALEKRLKEQKETARKAAGTARKAGDSAVEKQASEAVQEREAIEREQITLVLPTPLPQPSLSARPPSRKRKQIDLPQWYEMPSWAQVNSAFDAASRRCQQAEAASDAAFQVFEVAQSEFERAEAKLNALKKDVPGLPSQWERYNIRFDAHWDKYESAEAARDTAADVVKTAAAAVDQRCTELERWMQAWCKREHRVTPFPWVGDEYIEPCSAIDLDYYEKRPDACPPGVREWYARYCDYLTPECNHHVIDNCDACNDARCRGTMRKISRNWAL